MRFADRLIIICVTLAGHNTDPVLYASGLLFKRPMKSDGNGYSSFSFLFSFVLDNYFRLYRRPSLFKPFLQSTPGDRRHRYL